MDVLTDVLSTAGMTLRVDEVIRAEADWKKEIRSSPQITFYAIADGNCSLSLNQQTVDLPAGEMIFLHHEVAHSLKNTRPSPVTLIAGAIRFTSGLEGMAFLGLPSMMTLAAPAAIDSIFRQFVTETTSAGPGWRVVSEALATSLFIYALRTRGRSNGCETHGWLRGLSDAEIGEALRLMHQRPAHRWTVAELAESLSISRSAFAARFKAVTGRPPLDYLTWWRLYRAAARLRRRDGATLAKVAREAGYDSDASFSKAFRREFGMPPGDVRREAAAQNASPLQFEIKKQNPFESPEQETGLNLFKTTSQFAVEYEELFSRHSLSSPQYNILRILRGVGIAISKSEVLSRMVIPSSNPIKLFDGLIKLKMIRVTKPSDQCLITDHGLHVLSQIDEPLLDIHRRQLAHFSAGELAELNRLLVKARRPDY